MLQAVIYYIVTVILTKELVIATDQCTEYQFKSPFFPGVSCEDIYNKNPESHDKPGYYWILDDPRRVYCGMNYTGSSCEDIYNSNPETSDKSGYYRIDDNQWMYCNMTAITNGNFISTCAGVGGGWRRIVNINISAGDDCPGEWRKATQSGVSFCRVANDDGEYTCSSASFSTNGISYQRVCGRARGYQKEFTLAFYRTDYTQLIKNMYLDCQSLTVVILVSTFGLLPVALVKHLITFITVLVQFIQDTVLNLLLVVTIIASPAQWTILVLRHITLTTHYGMEKDAWIIVVMTLLNLGSIDS